MTAPGSPTLFHTNTQQVVSASPLESITTDSLQCGIMGLVVFIVKQSLMKKVIFEFETQPVSLTDQHSGCRRYDGSDR